MSERGRSNKFELEEQVKVFDHTAANRRGVVVDMLFVGARTYVYKLVMLDTGEFYYATEVYLGKVVK